MNFSYIDICEVYVIITRFKVIIDVCWITIFNIVDVIIEDAQGITLFGSRINIKERIHEAA